MQRLAVPVAVAATLALLACSSEKRDANDAVGGEGEGEGPAEGEGEGPAEGEGEGEGPAEGEGEGEGPAEGEGEGPAEGEGEGEGPAEGEGEGEGGPDCPDPNDPEVRYLSDDPQVCAAMRFVCRAPGVAFTNECGCGCIGEQRECQVDCDCNQGLLCADGQCLAGFAPQWCCDKPGCPPGARCVDRQGNAKQCAGNDQ